MIIHIEKRRFKDSGKRVLPGLWVWDWRYRWLLFVVMLLTYPLQILYLIPLAREGFGWLPLVFNAGMLLILLSVGARRQSRPYVPFPPGSRTSYLPAPEVPLLSEFLAACCVFDHASPPASPQMRKSCRGSSLHDVVGRTLRIETNTYQLACTVAEIEAVALKRASASCVWVCPVGGHQACLKTSVVLSNLCDKCTNIRSVYLEPCMISDLKPYTTNEQHKESCYKRHIENDN